MLGAHTKVHGTNGIVEISEKNAALAAMMGVTPDTLKETVKLLPHVQVEEGKNRNGMFVVTWKHWQKYQTDSTVAERQKRWRDGKRNGLRGEEKRREEKREENTLQTPPTDVGGNFSFPEIRPIRSLTPKPKKLPTDPRVSEFRSYFVEQWKKKYGSEPYWKFGHYEKLLKSLLGWADQNGGVERLKEAVQEFMASADEKVLDSRHSFAWFHATLNTWTVKRKTWMDKFDEKFGGQK